jgi:hypothetical protein
MIRWLIMAAALMAVVAVSTVAVAHEGHAHKVMGTVAALHENHLEVKAVDGKTTTITLDDKTKVFRGKAKATAQDIKPGERVIVTFVEKKGPDGKATMIATEVRLAERA